MLAGVDFPASSDAYDREARHGGMALFWEATTMRGPIKLVVVLLFVLLVGGMVLAFIGKVRNTANRIQCANNLHQIGMALRNYQDCWGHFPTGTVPNTGLPPDRRLSWLVQVWPHFMEGGTKTCLDETKAWDAMENCPPHWQARHLSALAVYEWGDPEPLSELRVFLCPANPARLPSSLPSPTHYVGVAGLGEEAAELPLSDPRAGLFGYDRIVSLGNLKRGTSTTLAIAEVLDGGPWTAGGRATIRGLSVGQAPYLGEAGQFTSLHRSGKLTWPSPIVTNVALADASVRGLTAAVSPEVVEKLVTIAGNESVGWFDAE
jgi:hypothetical protein